MDVESVLRKRVVGLVGRWGLCGGFRTDVGKGAVGLGRDSGRWQNARLGSCSTIS